jgi:hypothetical protein
MEVPRTPSMPFSAETTGRTPGDAGLDALPIHLVDLGKAKPKDLKALKRGGGKLHQEVIEALEEIEFNLGEEADGKTILPVVIVVERKRKRRSALPLNIF